MCSVLRKSWHIRFSFSGFTTDSFCTTPTLQYIVHSYRTVNQFESSYIYFWHSLVLSIGFITVFYDLDFVQYYVPRSYTTVLYAHKMRNHLAYSDILVESTLCAIHKLIKTALPNWAIFTNIKAIHVSNCVFDQTPQVSRFYNILKSVGFHVPLFRLYVKRGTHYVVGVPSIAMSLIEPAWYISHTLSSDHCQNICNKKYIILTQHT